MLYILLGNETIINMFRVFPCFSMCTGGGLYAILVVRIPVLPVSVNKHITPEKNTCGEQTVFRAPNQGEDRSFGYWIAWSKLAQKECFFTDTGSYITFLD